MEQKTKRKSLTVILGMILACTVVAAIFCCREDDHSEHIAETKNVELFQKTRTLGTNQNIRSFSVKFKSNVEPEPKNQNQKATNMSTRQNNRKPTNDVISRPTNTSTNLGSSSFDLPQRKFILITRFTIVIFASLKVLLMRKVLRRNTPVRSASG